MSEVNGQGEFDARFERAAEFLGRGRPSYPAELYDLMLRAGGGRRFERALDLGCGAGHSLAGLFSIADEVHALEPGPDLFALACREYPEAHITEATAEETKLPSASVDLVTIATAFTWMNHQVVLREAHRILKRPGLLAIYAYGFPKIKGAAGEVLSQRLVEDWDAFRSDLLRDPIDVGECLSNSGFFSEIESLVVPHWIEHDARSLTAFLESTSFVRAFLAEQPNPSLYISQLEAELRAAGGATFEVDFALQTTLARAR